MPEDVLVGGIYMVGESLGKMQGIGSSIGAS